MAKDEAFALHSGKAVLPEASFVSPLPLIPTPWPFPAPISRSNVFPISVHPLSPFLVFFFFFECFSVT